MILTVLRRPSIGLLGFIIADVSRQKSVKMIGPVGCAFQGDKASAVVGSH
jgi:hypothetical protein